MDRINLSDTKFIILAAIASANARDLNDRSLSRSTVYHRRKVHRSTIEIQVCQEFKASDKPPLVVHWDGKLMRDSTNKLDHKSETDRIAVCITGHEVDKVLGIAKMK